ncbi:hypothetical protein KEM55_003501 [Ascosphaera atra]|nr:hypothetical protein KEM55_003501 [Ascosphaera atra]
MKEDRGGIGMDTEKKRKIREQFESEAKRAKADESEYWERVRREREERRQEGQFHAAQKIIEGLETENAEEKEDGAEDPGIEPASKKQKRSRKPLSEVNILYRGLVYSRLEEEREKKARREALSRSSAAHNLTIAGLPVPDESELDADDKLALGHDGEALRHVAEEKEEDEELEEFNALPAFERLSKAVLYLREKYYYCFWCKYRYENADMEGCPGLTEEDHD